MTDKTEWNWGQQAFGAGNTKELNMDFVQKLYCMLEECQGGNIVSWAPDGRTFVIFDQLEFTKDILPKYFKHQNYASFVRQLNKYDFHKVKSAVDRYPDNASEFKHPEFFKGNKDNLDKIKRKAPGSSRKTATVDTLDHIERLEAEVSTLQSAYSNIVSTLEALQSDKANLESRLEKLNNTVLNQSNLISQLMTIVNQQQRGPPAQIPSPLPQIHHPNSSAQSTKRSWKILLAEDDEYTAEVCSRMLERFGSHVDLVSNGLEALEKSQSKHYDVIILNQILGSLDGFSCCSNIRRSGSKTPVVIMLVDEDNNLEERCVKCGVTRILRKPFKKSQLYEVLTVVLQEDHDIKMDDSYPM